LYSGYWCCSSSKYRPGLQCSQHACVGLVHLLNPRNPIIMHIPRRHEKEEQGTVTDIIGYLSLHASPSPAPWTTSSCFVALPADADGRRWVVPLSPFVSPCVRAFVRCGRSAHLCVCPLMLWCMCGAHAITTWPPSASDSLRRNEMEQDEGGSFFFPFSFWLDIVIDMVLFFFLIKWRFFMTTFLFWPSEININVQLSLGNHKCTARF
jgi:hypothetical protein